MHRAGLCCLCSGVWFFRCLFTRPVVVCNGRVEPVVECRHYIIPANRLTLHIFFDSHVRTMRLVQLWCIVGARSALCSLIDTAAAASLPRPVAIISVHRRPPPPSEHACYVQ